MELLDHLLGVGSLVVVEVERTSLDLEVVVVPAAEDKGNLVQHLMALTELPILVAEEAVAEVKLDLFLALPMQEDLVSLPLDILILHKYLKTSDEHTQG